MTIEERLKVLENEVARLRGAEGVRTTLSRYARAVDTKDRPALAALFTADAVIRVEPWGVEGQGREDVLAFFDDYFARFDHPRRYCANAEIVVEASQATAFTYWLVTQVREGKSIIGWGTYDWAFRQEGAEWRIALEVVKIHTMTTLDQGWAERPILAF